MLYTIIVSLLLHGALGRELVGSFAGYYTLAEVDTFMVNVKAKMTDLATTPVSIGTSRGGRKIMAMCLGQCSDKSKPAALFTGLHHAREPMGLMSVLYTMEHLVEMYLAGDSATAALLEARSCWFVPAVNPDGYQKNQDIKPNGGGNQRKNSNKEDSNACGSNRYDDEGVDLNRNYPTCWSGDCPTSHDIVKHSDCGSSKKPCDEDYRGTAAFSEPETRAIRDLIVAQEGSITTALNFHSFAQQVYMPYSCVKLISSEPERDRITMERMGTTWGKLASYGVNHVWNTEGAGLGYSAAGDASDWMFYEHGIFTLTPETGPKDEDVYKALGKSGMGDAFYEYGFWPPKNKILQYSNDTIAANVDLLWNAGPSYEVTILSLKVNTVVTVVISIKNIGVNDTTRTPLVVSVVHDSEIEDEYVVMGFTEYPVIGPTQNDHIKMTLQVDNNKMAKIGKPGEPTHLPTIVIGDSVTCGLYKVTQMDAKTKKYLPAIRTNIRHCSLCKQLMEHPEIDGTTTTPAPTTAGPMTTTPSSSNPSKATTTPAPSSTAAPDNTKKGGGSGSSGSGDSGGGTTTKAPCTPMSSPGDPNADGNKQLDDNKIDWTMMWVVMAVVIGIGCCCGMLMTLCVRQYGNLTKYSDLEKSRMMDDSDDDTSDDDAVDLSGIEIGAMGRYKDQPAGSSDEENDVDEDEAV